jgi:hypothetical protein
MPKLADPASQGPRRPDLVSDELWSELRSRAHERRTEIFECLGPQARRDPDAALEQVILVARRYRWFAALFDSAPSRKILRDRLIALQGAVRTASDLLNSRDTWLFAALSCGGLSENEARALDRGSESNLQIGVASLGQAAEAALKMVQLSGPASGQKPMLGPKQLLALDCGAIFEKYRPGEVKKPKGRGPGYPPFVEIVGEIATGGEWSGARTPIRDARAALRDGRAVQPTSISPANAFDWLSCFRDQLKALSRKDAIR